MDSTTCPIRTSFLHSSRCAAALGKRPKLSRSPWAILPPSPTLPRRYCVQVQELVWTLVVLLDLGTADLVMAFYMLELCARAQRGLFKPNALRPLLIGCCVIARKLKTDARRVGD